MDDSKLSVLLGWLERGWALVPLHDVSAGHCSCQGLKADCHGLSAGKHPRYGKWQEAGQLVRDGATLLALHVAHPEWNWGVATGEVSGIWVLDVDGEPGADALADLCFEHGAQEGNVGMWMNTLALGPTGGRGVHYVFELPPDFVPRGSQGRSRNGLPPGLDVRGHHGQIVVAPSVSGKGPYGAVLIDAPVRRAPAWLEDMLRPKPEPERPERAAPVADLRLDPVGVPVGSLSGSVGVDARAWSYARSAVNALLAELAAAEPGTRDDTTIRVAYRLVELGNAPWSGYTLDVLELAWTEARMMAADHAAVEATLPAKWARAVATVGGAAAVLPPSYVGGEHIPILEMASSGISGGISGGLPPDFAAAPALPFGDPITHSAPVTAPVPGASPGVSGGPDAPAQPPIVMPAAPVPFTERVAALLGQMLTPEQLAELPPPEPLVNGLLDLDTCAWIIGRPGCGKSFVTLDIAAHVGLGKPWQGRAVRQGRVVIMVAEGSRGVRLRADAWRREYGPMKDVLFLPLAVPVNERTGRYGASVAGAWSVFVEACRQVEPVLVVIDTQARVTAGLNENDSGDMGYYVEQADRIRQATGATVLSVHHQGRTGENARGSSAIDGAQDSELRVERNKGSMLLKIHMDKQKDQAEVDPISVALRVSPGGLSADGRDLSSLVLVASDGTLTFQDPSEPVPPKWQQRMIALYQLILDRYNAGAGGTEAEIRKAFKALPDVATLDPDGRDKAWARAWNGTASAPGLVPRGLIAQKAGAARFKIIEIADQSAEGVLTANDIGGNPTSPPDGWNLYLPDLSGGRRIAGPDSGPGL